MDQTAFQFSGVGWNIFDHILGLFVIGITVHIVSKRQKNENYRIIQAVLVAAGVILYSLIIELTMPMKLIAYSLPVSFAVETILSKIFCKLGWKKAIIMGAILFAVTLVVGILEGVLLAFIKLSLSSK